MVRFYVQLLIEFLFQLTFAVLKTTFIPSHAFIRSVGFTQVGEIEFCGFYDWVWDYNQTRPHTHNRAIHADERISYLQTFYVHPNNGDGQIIIKSHGRAMLN